MPDRDTTAAGEPGFPDEQRSPEEVVDQATQVIHSCMENLAFNLFEVGRQLVRVKKILEHGRFRMWIFREFGLKERTAQHLMNVYLRLGRKAHVFRQVKPTALYHLAMPSTPAQAIALVEERIRAGNRLSVQEVVAIIAACRTPPPPEDLATVAARLAKAVGKASTWLSNRTVADCERVLGEQAAERLAEIRSELNSFLDQVQSRLPHARRRRADAWRVVSKPDPPIPAQAVGAVAAVPHLPTAARGQSVDGSVADERIGPGCTVVVCAADTGQAACYTLVTEEPGQPEAGRIHWDSPVAQALRDQRAGEIVTAQTPDGPLRLAIRSVRFPDGRLTTATEGADALIDSLIPDA
jgi:hypothetical protein